MNLPLNEITRLVTHVPESASEALWPNLIHTGWLVGIPEVETG